MTRTVNLYEAKTQLSSLVEEVAASAEIVIAKNGKGVARLVRLAQKSRKVELGFWRGQAWMSDDFADPLPDDIINEMLNGDDDLFELMSPKKADEGTAG